MIRKMVKFGDVVNLQNGYAFKSKEYSSDGYFVMRITNVQKGYISNHNPRYVQIKSNSNLAKLILKEQDILLSLTGDVGRAGIIKKEHLPCVLNQRVAKIDIIDKTLLDKEFLFLFLNSDIFLKKVEKLAHGSAQNNVSTKDILNINFNLPSIIEQQRIAARLNAIFAEIDKLIKINFSKLNYIDAVKNSTLNNKMGNNLIKLDKACDLIKRGISPKYLETGGICVINQKCIRNHKIDFSKARRHNINLKKVPEERFIRKGDVLINSTGQGTLGRVAQVRKELLEKTTVDSHVTIVRPKQNLFNSNFFGNSLIKIEKQLQAAGEGTSGQTELSRSRLVNEFFVPYIKSIDKQKKIALLLDSMFEKTFILKNLTTKMIENQKALKTSFLYKEFNNKVA